jgi:hypothetical protein
MNLSDISRLFSNHGKANQTHAALDELSSAGLAECRTVQTDGRPQIVWVAL